jgi:hypothetical protein
MFFSIRLGKERRARLMSSALNVRDAKGAEPILPVERTTMRLSILIPAVLVFAAPAVAENWQEYRYPDQFFAVAFPGDPQTEATTYQVAADRSVAAHVYSVRQDNAVFKVTVAELADTGLEEGAVIDHAIKAMSEGGEVKVNIPHRINRVYGRQLSIVGPDGIRSMVAVFDYNGRLYQIEGQALPTGNDATADAIRFVQSLIFTGGGSNRSGDEIRAAQGACSGPGGPGGAAAAGDTRRFEIRCRRQQSFAALASSLNSGDLSGAQQAYSSLSQLPRFANPNGPFGQAISQIGQALQNGDLPAAQQALASLQLAQRGTRQP